MVEPDLAADGDAGTNGDALPVAILGNFTAVCREIEGIVLYGATARSSTHILLVDIHPTIGADRAHNRRVVRPRVGFR